MQPGALTSEMWPSNHYRLTDNNFKTLNKKQWRLGEDGNNSDIIAIGLKKAKTEL